MSSDPGSTRVALTFMLKGDVIASKSLSSFHEPKTEQNGTRGACERDGRRGRPRCDWQGPTAANRCLCGRPACPTVSSAVLLALGFAGDTADGHV